MASKSAAARLCILARNGAPQITRISRVQRAVQQQSPIAQRAFTTSTTRWAREEGDEAEEETGPLTLTKLEEAMAKETTPEALKQLDALAKENGYNSIDEYIEQTLYRTPGWASEDRALADELQKDEKGARANKQSFWFDEEDPETNTEEVDEFDEDDITSMAHGKLDQIREMRHYARLAVWEMPLLSKLAPEHRKRTRDEFLRWRYTTYMGESHPSEKKVVVEFHVKALPLDQAARRKLIKLAGPRFNPGTGFVKLSCESFEQPAQNKRYLLELVRRLIAAAKDPKDDFKDIPIDTRHYKPREVYPFPNRWIITNGRREALEEKRREIAADTVGRIEQGKLIDGVATIDSYLATKAAEEREKAKLAEMVAVPARPTRGAGARR